MANEAAAPVAPAALRETAERTKRVAVVAVHAGPHLRLGTCIVDLLLLEREVLPCLRVSGRHLVAFCGRLPGVVGYGPETYPSYIWATGTPAGPGRCATTAQHHPARHRHSTCALLCQSLGLQPCDPASCSRAPPPQPRIVAHPPGLIVRHFATPPASSSPLPPPAMSAPSRHRRWARGQGRRAQARQDRQQAAPTDARTQRSGDRTCDFPWKAPQDSHPSWPGQPPPPCGLVPGAGGLPLPRWCHCSFKAFGPANTSPHRWSAQCHRTRSTGWSFKTEVLNLNLKLKFKTKFYSLTRSLASHCSERSTNPPQAPICKIDSCRNGLS